MLSDITIKGAAIMELSLYEKFRETFGQEPSCFAVIAGTGLCVTDVCIDTAKYPIAAIEQLGFSIINGVGASCFEECTMRDALKSLSNAVVGFCVATPTMTLLGPLKLLGHLCKTLPNLREARPSNQEAEAEARLEWIKRAPTPVIA